MSKVTLYDKQGASVGDYEVADGLLVTDRGEQAVHDVVVAIRNAQRSGTASTLAKGEVAGSGKKPWKQKGTGRARAGYRQSPVWRGGSVVFGPKPRSYANKINRKVAKLAFRRALSDKIVNGELKVVDELALAEPRTKLFTEMVKALGIQRSALFVVADVDRNLALGARNLPNIALARAAEVNVLELLRYQTIIVSKAGMEGLKGRLGGEVEESK